jgi:signal transduction histidine kinase
VGVLAEGPIFLLTFFLFLAFPMGRLEPPAARWLMGALGVVLFAFFLPWALFSPMLAGAGPLTLCAPACPENVLQVGSALSIVEVAGKAESYALPAITAATFVVYLARLRTASSPQRRSLGAVAVTSLLYLPVYFVYSFAAWILIVDPATVDTLAWGVAATRALLPLGFLIALLGAERFAGKALRTLLELLAARPTPELWRDKIAGVLDDRSLRLGYHDPGTGRFREPDGGELTPPPADGLAWVPVDRDDQPVAAMVVDETLAEDPELVRAAASATLLAVENGHLEGELIASRARILEAGHAERRRIERDLHDSAQQRLVALRIHLALTGEQLDRSEERGMLERLGAEVDQAIDELRAVAQGVYPQILAQGGVGPALASVARGSAIPVSIRDAGVGRHSEGIEMTVYFCCLECLQNAAKHAGRGAAVTIRLSEANASVSASRTTGRASTPAPPRAEPASPISRIAWRPSEGRSGSMPAPDAEPASPAASPPSTAPAVDASSGFASRAAIWLRGWCAGRGTGDRTGPSGRSRTSSGHRCRRGAPRIARSPRSRERSVWKSRRRDSSSGAAPRGRGSSLGRGCRRRQGSGSLPRPGRLRSRNSRR